MPARDKLIGKRDSKWNPGLHVLPSAYEETSLANGLGGNPASLLETSFGIPKSVIEQLPKREKRYSRRKA